MIYYVQTIYGKSANNIIVFEDYTYCIMDSMRVLRYFCGDLWQNVVDANMQQVIDNLDFTHISASRTLQHHPNAQLTQLDNGLWEITAR